MRAMLLITFTRWSTLRKEKTLITFMKIRRVMLMAMVMAMKIRKVMDMDTIRDTATDMVTVRKNLTGMDMPKRRNMDIAMETNKDMGILKRNSQIMGMVILKTNKNQSICNSNTLNRVVDFKLILSKVLENKWRQRTIIRSMGRMMLMII
jgi:hypothetical protein